MRILSRVTTSKLHLMYQWQSHRIVVKERIGIACASSWKTGDVVTKRMTYHQHHQYHQRNRNRGVSWRGALAPELSNAHGFAWLRHAHLSHAHRYHCRAFCAPASPVARFSRIGNMPSCRVIKRSGVGSSSSTYRKQRSSGGYDNRHRRIVTAGDKRIKRHHRQTCIGRQSAISSSWRVSTTHHHYA